MAGHLSNREAMPDDFPSESPEVDGASITDVELKTAIDRAEHYGLLTIRSGGMGAGLPFEVCLSSAGHEFVEVYGGDMHRWQEAQRGVPTVTYDNRVDNSVNVTARDYTQVVAHAQKAVANMTAETIDSARLREAGTAAWEVSDLLHGPAREEVADAGKELVQAADGEDVDRTRTVAQRLLDLLTASAGSLAVIRFVIDALTCGLGGH